MTARAAPCPLPGDPSKCQLPDCFCSSSGTVIPGGLTPQETPQMVIITLDDAIVTRLMPVYRQLFDGRFKNPDGKRAILCLVKDELTNFSKND